MANNRWPLWHWSLSERDKPKVIMAASAQTPTLSAQPTPPPPAPRMRHCCEWLLSFRSDQSSSKAHQISVYHLNLFGHRLLFHGVCIIALWMETVIRLLLCPATLLHSVYSVYSVAHSLTANLLLNIIDIISWFSILWAHTQTHTHSTHQHDKTVYWVWNSVFVPLLLMAFGCGYHRPCLVDIVIGHNNQSVSPPPSSIIFSFLFFPNTASQLFPCTGSCIIYWIYWIHHQIIILSLVWWCRTIECVCVCVCES